ncbi:MAG TPA: beta-galactosidase [Acidimicrobiales bacterium]|nr:beta-galactosidase [Acidimicrobiales bacterium]
MDQDPAPTAGPDETRPGAPVYYGGDYNPEQWPREVWDEDVKLMREAGVNLVSVGIFSWAHLEPAEGRFEFDWLRDVLDLLGAAGIGADLATPTAAPPPWLTTGYPDVLPVDARGARYSHGSRQHFCVCSPTYLRFAMRIVERLVEEVGDHSALRMWHVHNEYGCHVPYCYCDNHAAAFRSWLEERYGSITGLNDAWGTAFWSQRYNDFGEVLPPRYTPTFANPGQELDYKRFSSDAFLEEFRQERKVLSAARPDMPVTTNFMGFFKPVDYFRWSRELDIVSTDNYPDPSDPDAPVLSAMHYDLVRSLNKDAPWMVMEQTSYRVNWRERNVPKVPGQMRALSYQALARGASGVLFFQWRASRTGAEKFHSAMVSHSGQASPVWADVTALGRELTWFAALNKAVVEADCAVAFSWPNWWALEGPAGPAHDFKMLDQLGWMLRELYHRQVTVDFCHPGEALDRYRGLVVPSLYLVTEDEGANIRSFVHNGGTAFISFWSGIVDEHDRVYLGPYGGPLRPLLGCDVVDVAPLAPGDVMAVEWEDGTRTSATFWTDVISEGTGRVLARTASGPRAGAPAVIEAGYGQGTCYYVGTRLDREGMEKLYDLAPALKTEGARGTGQAADGVERVVRRSSTHAYEFLINHSHNERKAALARPGFEMLAGQVVQGQLAMGPQGVAVVRYEAGST